MSAALEVVRAGLLTTVQDAGRPGLGRFGVSPSGAMDPLALRLANRLLGNPPGAPALEITGPGVELLWLEARAWVVGGADLGVAPWTVARAAPGQRLAFGARVRGARAVLAVAGGLLAPQVLGSAATDLDGGIGQRLARSQRLGAGPPPAARPPPDAAALARALAAYEDPFVLRYVPDDDPAVPPVTAARFASSAFRVSDRSNRTGYRLTGLPLDVRPQPDRLSEPVAPGAIQLPPDGGPILLMADRQTTGGYARLGHLIAADRPRAAQLWPGDEVRFVPVTVAEAQAAARAQAAAAEVI